jgi:gas vesicle protein
MGKGKKFGLGVLVGAVAGVAAGILAAPKSGKETRKDIKNKAGEVKVSAERKLKEAHKELASLSADTQKAALGLKGKAKDELDQLSKKADELKDKVKVAITSIKSGDDDSDDATIDQIMKDVSAVKAKISKKIKEARSK